MGAPKLGGIMFTKYLLLLTFLMTACVTYDQHDTSVASGSYGLAKQLEDDERYEEALLQYRDVKNRFPYSKYATLAELQIAEIQFKKEAFVEAQGAYQLFKELHPKHPKVDYVTYKTGESIFMQLPSTIDRDLSVAPLAVREFDVLLRDFPNSPHAEAARKKRAETIEKLAQKELYIADFYYRTDEWQHAMVRYEKYLKEYPEHKKRPHAYFRAAMAAEKFGEDKKRNELFRTLIKNHPNSDEAGRAKGIL